MVNWVKVGTSVGLGAAVGVGDQLIQNQDDKRSAGFWKQYGTYYNYGLPLLAVLGTTMGWIPSGMSDNLIVAGSVLAGRKATDQITNASTASTFRQFKKTGKNSPKGNTPPKKTGSVVEF